MAEAFAVVGLAANIFQFIELGINIIQAAKELNRSADGITSETRQLDLIVEDIKNASSAALKRNPKTLSPDELAIKNYAKECIELSEQLERISAQLQARDDARSAHLERLRVATQMVLKRGDVQRLQQRLLAVETRLRDRLSKLFQVENQSSITAQLQEIKRKHKEADIASQLQLSDIRDEILKLVQTQRETDEVYTATTACLVTKLKALLVENKRANEQFRIISALHFPELKRRQSAIDNAHFQTLGWLFDSSHTPFIDWLRHRGGTFWFNGLAGSGKSTLMKYAYRHDETVRALEKWAYPASLVTASHFFWNQGFPIQKSQVGLLQTLLYQVLKAVPELAVELCSDHLTHEPWEIDELKGILKELSRRTVLSTKFCFFIDGLDEYDGEEEDILEILSTLTRSPNIKICTSSRPWPKFEEAFTDSNRILKVQDYTLPDMKAYIADRLVMNNNFRALRRRDPRCKEFVPEIAKRSQGVWLWVYLVTRDMRRALDRFEEYETLRRILESFPGTLEDYFRNIIERLDPIYREDMSQIFLLTVDAIRPLPLVVFTFLELQRANESYALLEEHQPTTDDEALEQYQRWKVRMHTRCGDLLSVRADGNEELFFKYRVDFLHRTVRDFLRDSYFHELEEGSGNGFDAKVSLCRMMLVLIKRLPSRSHVGSFSTIFALVEELLLYAHEGEKSGAEPQNLLLNELDVAVAEHREDMLNHWTNAWATNGGLYDDVENCTFLALTIEAKLTKYVETELVRNPKLIRKSGRPLLDYALRPGSRVSNFHKVNRAGIDVDMVRLLLDRGANPNEPVNPYVPKETVWRRFLLSCIADVNKASQDTITGWYQAAELLIDRGADSELRDPELRAPYEDPGLKDLDSALVAIFHQARANSLRQRIAEVQSPIGKKTWVRQLRSWLPI